MTEIMGELVDQCIAFLHDEYDAEIEAAAETGGNVEISWQRLHEYNADLADDYLDEPKIIKVHLTTAVEDMTGIEDDDERPSLFVTELPEGTLYDVGDYHPDNVIERNIAIRGQVTKRSKRQLRDDVTVFKCRYCGTRTEHRQHGKQFSMPEDGCSGCERKDGLVVDNKNSTLTNYQEIRLQALPEKTASTASEEIDVELTGELVGEVDPGDRAIVNAMVDSERVNDSRIRELYARANSLELLETSHTDIDYEPYIEEIEDIAASDDVFEQVVGSIAPSHHGDRQLKLALALAIFGGVKKQLPDGSTKRGNSHIIVIGDPGTGKSDILDYVQNLVPRAEYASGKQTSSAGLTASAVHDDFGGDGWTLEAGTLVRAHEGVALIDELDKMSEDDRGGMVEAMSEQQISVNKAASGTLPAETTVIAACNPKYGRFDPMKDIGSQLDFHAALLSRFDLWFVMEDNPDRERDRDIAQHMNETAQVGQELADEDLSETELRERADESVVPDIAPDVFRAYVSYARRIVPKLTDDAAEMIEDDYVEVRDENDKDGPVPVTARSIDALHRLAEASARIRLSERVTTDDVQRAIRIRDYCFETMGIDPDTGELDALRLETGEPESAHERRQHIKDVVGRLEDELGEAPHEDEIKEECMMAMDESQFEDGLQKLRRKGELYEPSTDCYRVS